ncbi:VOC family protein [Streptomyces smyrnaeus]|uniref:VOC family protein n=1 Tax=Streptomyces smyrnaeus TaxID=1387713 RepID=UPI0033DCEF60
MTSELHPKLLVSDADAAIDFYAKTLGATPTIRVADDHGVVNHAELTLGSAVLALAQSVEEWGWHDPASLGGSPVLVTANVSDPDATADRMVQLGGELVIPVEDRPYGKRQGRVRDPFGHLWVISGDLHEGAAHPS